MAFAEVCFGQVPTRAPLWYPGAATYDAPFVEGATYDPAVPTPDQILGFPLGSRPALHAEVERCLAAWASSKRMTLHEYARSHEQRRLYYAVITSPDNHAKLDVLRGAIGKLADPRGLDDGTAKQMIELAPAVAWMAYSIHGDELSGTDSALALVYHLIASKDAAVEKLLSEVVVLVDPMMNPDGRDRYIHMIDAQRGYTPSLDDAAGQHAGRWPWGRGNHYLFDLNRDWALGVHPETRGRQRAVAEWHPQLFVDAHEMGSHDTFLFNPPRDPFNPHLPETMAKWWAVFAADQGRAFDRFGWSYYTREWLEFWYPGYSDSWGCFHGAIGILYEQASTSGHPLRQRDGSILSYREAVHHQLTSSLANLETLRANRVDILTDYWKQKKAALAVEGAPGLTFLMPPSDNASRQRAFLSNLVNQGIEVGVAAEPFAARGLTDTLRRRHDSREFPAGTYVISRRQPAGPLLGALLDPDPRMDDEFLASERKELETKRESRIYDVTGWSLAMSYALESYWSDEAVQVRTEPFGRHAAPESKKFHVSNRAYAYIIDGADDTVMPVLVTLLQRGITVHVAEKSFRAAGRTFPRGSLLIRRHANAHDLEDRLTELFANVDVSVYVADGARSPDDGPDLGGGHFLLLERPRVALFGGGGGIDFTRYGSVWRLLDEEIGVPVSLLDVTNLYELDLRAYNVIILPDTWGPAEGAYDDLLELLQPWVRNGGTLIAIGDAAAFLADKESELSDVRRRRDVLDELYAYAQAAALERAAGRTPIDARAVWDDPVETPLPAPASEAGDGEADQSDGDGEDDGDDATPTPAEARDEWRRVFSPTGTILRGEVNVEHWLAFGCDAKMPLFADGSSVLLSRHPVETPVRLASFKELRLSGLLWPEAAARMADSAYATRESQGRGQVILFAHEPDFRGTWHGTRRLLLNAVLLGPGCGVSQPVPNGAPAER